MTKAETELLRFKREIITAIQTETHAAIKDTGNTWVVQTVEKAVPIVIEATLEKLGLDCKKPFEAQRDFAYLRSQRTEAEDRRKVFFQIAIKWVVGISFSAITAGLTAWGIVCKTP